MENFVFLYTKEICHNQDTSESTKCKLSKAQNETQFTSDGETSNMTIPGIDIQPDCIKVSSCGNYVAAINKETNELLVCSLQVGIGILTPPVFTSTLNLNINDGDNRKIQGWDKEALGQYHGLEKKESAALLQKPTTPFLDPETISISWSRFETTEQIYLCVNAYTKDLKRYLALFNITKQRLDSSWHEASMDHKLGHAIGWRPRCNQLAVPFQSGDRHYVGIWERGALVRGIELGIRDIPVVGLEFSDDGAALYVWQQLFGDESRGEVGGAYISIYHYFNGGWMRKQQLQSKEQLHEVNWACAIEESAMKTYTIKMMKQNRHESWIQWGLRPDVSIDGEIALIDGRFVYITLLHKEVLPPGTSSLQLELPLPSTTANQVFLHHSKPIIAVLCDRLLVHFYNRQTGASLFDKAVNIDHLNNDKYSHLTGTWTELKNIISTQECEQFRLSNVTHEEITVCIEAGCEKEACMKGRKNGVRIPRELRDDGETENTNEILRQIYSMELDGSIFTFKLDFKGHFYINKDIVSKEINSLCLYCGYIFVTAYKTLYYFRVSSDNIATITQKCRIEFSNNELPSIEIYARCNLSFIHQRPIEVQAKLLTGSVGGLVLVMHRGNFELLQIPQINYDLVAKLMEEKKFEEAVSRVHLINLDPNVLVDSNIEGFISNAADFVKQVSDQSVIHLLISLTDELTLPQTKRARVCLALRTALLPNKGRFLPTDLPMIALTSFQATNPPSPIGAMMDISSFLKVALKDGMDETLVRDVVDTTLKALQAACAKEMKWFEYALRVSQEQELPRIVADVSRMDPRVYEPLLQELNKYKYDKCLYYHHVYKYLGEDDRALLLLLEWYKKRLNRSEDTDTVLEFIQKKHLHRRAMDVLINTSPNGEQETTNISALIVHVLPEVTKELLATHDRAYIRFAAALFERANQHERAVDVYATHDAYPNVTISVTSMMSNNMMDPEEIISTLVKDGQYSAAVFVARAKERKDLIDTVISQGIHERADILCDQIKEANDRFTKLFNRLKQVRLDQADRIPQQQRHHADDEDGTEVFDDTASMATTSASTSVSISTNASSNRRRQRRAARKADKLREGHARENINLVRALHQDIQWVFGLSQVATEFYEINISDPFIIGQDARALIKTILQLQREMIEKSKIIWPEEINMHLDPVNPGLSEALIKHVVALQHNWSYLEMVHRAQPTNMKNCLKTINSENR